jgi:hypothetical protein
MWWLIIFCGFEVKRRYVEENARERGAAGVGTRI